MKENKTNSIYKNIMIVVITSLITCIITTVVVYNYFIVKAGIGGTVNSIISAISGNSSRVLIDSKLSEINKKLNDIYIGEIDDKKLIEGALEGYVAGLGDEYTEYLTEDEISSLMEDVKGSYVGVGLYIAQNAQTNEILVAGVIEDSPGHKAGILAGDIIDKIDDVEYTGEQLTQASNDMKGIEGTDVKVTVLREGKEIDFKIKREKIKFKYVRHEKLGNNIGYIKISSFEGKCADEFKNAYNELHSQGIKSLIIDLRNNGGGLVDQCLDIAEMIVPNKSKMLITTDKDGNEEVSVSDSEPIVDVPIVILVNDYTASASEILTAAIRENVETARVVGTQTYGKGVIQGVFLFEDQKTGLKVTMQEYFTPNHNKLNKIGITPDFVVELPDEWKGHITVDRKYDNQLAKAIELLK